MLREMSGGAQSEDLTPYGALSVPVQRRLKLGSFNGDDSDSILVAPSSLNLEPYGALSDRVQLRLSQGYAGYAALPASPNTLTDDTILVEVEVEASNTKTNPRFSPGIQQRQPSLTPYGALAGARPLNF